MLLLGFVPLSGSSIFWLCVVSLIDSSGLPSISFQTILSSFDRHLPTEKASSSREKNPWVPRRFRVGSIYSRYIADFVVKSLPLSSFFFDLFMFVLQFEKYLNLTHIVLFLSSSSVAWRSVFCL